MVLEAIVAVETLALAAIGARELLRRHVAQKVEAEAHKVMWAVLHGEGKVCSICNHLVARFEEIEGKVICFNCKS